MFLLLNDRHLHPIVYFIADKPGKKNLHPKIPLVGTPSYAKLLEWCAKMDIDITRIRLYNQSENPFTPLSVPSLNIAIKSKHIRVIALGKNAFKYLMKIGVEEFYSLPHPSPANKKSNLNIEDKIQQCRNYIYG